MPLRNLNRPCQSVHVCPTICQFYVQHAAIVMLSTFLLEIQTECGEGEWRHDRLVCCKSNTQGLWHNTEQRNWSVICHFFNWSPFWDGYYVGNFSCSRYLSKFKLLLKRLLRDDDIYRAQYFVTTAGILSGLVTLLISSERSTCLTSIGVISITDCFNEVHVVCKMILIFILGKWSLKHRVEIIVEKVHSFVRIISGNNGFITRWTHFAGYIWSFWNRLKCWILGVWLQQLEKLHLFPFDQCLARTT